MHFLRARVMRRGVFRNWLITLLSRPRVPEDTASDATAAPLCGSDGEFKAEVTFQPIRSQEDIQEEEAQERAHTRRSRVISRLFDDVSMDRVKSRQ